MIDEAVRILQAGGLVAFPTETVYGLGTDARNSEAVGRIFAAKGRPADHPLIVHLYDAKEMSEWAQDIPEVAWQLAEIFWPGPLTLILRRLPNVPDAVTGGLDTVALRVPNHPVSLELLRAFGGGIAAPSANRYGSVSPTSAEDVREELKDSVDLILDGGRCSIGIESTIVDLSTSTPKILRPGKITEEELYRVLGSPVATVSNTPVRYPGGNPSHYSPRARVVLASWDNVEQCIEEWQQRGQRVGLLASRLSNLLPENVIWLRLTQNIDEQAHELYHSLRQADHLGLEVLVAVMPEDVGIGHALRDRLRRAAGLGDCADV
ncbi:L-threonylcarbamoyladenylate synthase [Sulfurovum sp.]|uniref:L-threonylcarbamoyladenylate synthase n=1 Tax=Sulfurovum sp. TaxID=1969726 RepID=UPI002867E989|nr:L-threonylcarbamoyladenylate synthase [Sulfurovum sp.]